MTMTSPQIAALAGRAPTVPPEARHRHDSTCHWDVDDCRWQCVTYPRVHDDLEHCTAIGRPVADSRPKGRQ
jgi:hypothetical protein